MASRKPISSNNKRPNPGRRAKPSAERVGLWLVGGCGGVGSTVALAVAAFRKKLAPPAGLVTALPPFAHLDLTEPADFVLGGHEIRKIDWPAAVSEFSAAAGLFDAALVKACSPILQQFSRNLRPGFTQAAARPKGTWATSRKPANPLAAASTIADDLRNFKSRHKLDRVVVINLASTERPFALNAAHKSWPALEAALKKRGKGALPDSSLYALAAVRGGHAYVNFTPSLGATVPAILQMAEQTGAVIAGDDGKTGETLIKTVLAPMFAARNLRLLSWTGHNILGNRDGQTLDDPAVKASKIATKNEVLESIVGYRPESRVSIDFVESLNDWKTAWDFVHFSGLLGVQMSLQFIWQGCDSVLAAPLVLDLARLAAFHQRSGGAGVMRHTACFFKRPIGAGEHDFFKQHAMLLDYAASHSAKGAVAK